MHAIGNVPHADYVCALPVCALTDYRFVRPCPLRPALICGGTPRADAPSTSASKADEDVGTIKVVINRRNRLSSAPNMAESLHALPAVAAVNEKNKKRILGGQTVAYAASPAAECDEYQY